MLFSRGVLGVLGPHCTDLQPPTMGQEQTYALFLAMDEFHARW